MNESTVLKIGRWLVLASALLAGPVFAQSNFAGVWNAGYFEDWPDRFPGPELGD
jgi:hypothetical protein